MSILSRFPFVLIPSVATALAPARGPSSSVQNEGASPSNVVFVSSAREVQMESADVAALLAAAQNEVEEAASLVRSARALEHLERARQILSDLDGFLLG